MSFETPLPPFNASDAHATFLNVSCLDLLLIEMVPLAERMARRAERIERGELEVGAGVVAEVEEDGGEVAEVVKIGGGKEKKRKRKGRRKEKGVGEEEEEVGSGGIVDEEVYRDAIFFRLDGLGYRVGQGLSERYVVISVSWSLSSGGQRECEIDIESEIEASSTTPACHGISLLFARTKGRV